MKKTLSVGLLLALCLVLLASCAGGSLTGTWSHKDKNAAVTYTLSFAEDGTYVYAGLNDGETTPTDLMTGSYKADGDLLMFDGHACTYKVDASSLTITVHDVIFSFDRAAD